MITIAIENCTACQASSQGVTPGWAPGESQMPDNSSRNKGFTYDTGSGKKTSVALSGPLGSIFRQALGLVFDKKPLVPEGVAPDGETPSSQVISEAVQATEAMQQNNELVLLAGQMVTEPEFDVVLSDFKQSEVEDHANSVTENGVYDPLRDPAPVNALEPSLKINMYATNVEDIIQPRAQEIITELSEDAETIAYVQLDGLPVDLTNPEAYTSQVAMSQEAQTLGYRAALKASIERIIDNPRVHVVFGVQELREFMKG